jgi:ElaB/YqjD/DUF883 family membrane-anchored ribosome-binding protein
MGALEQRITGAVDCATGSVREASGAIKETVVGAVEEARSLYQRASDGVRQAFDLRQHVRDYPWGSVGAATVAGFVSGLVAPRARHAISQRLTAAHSGNGAAQRHSMFSDWGETVRRELSSLGEAAILAASSALKTNVQSLADELRTVAARRLDHHNGVHGSSV